VKSSAGPFVTVHAGVAPAELPAGGGTLFLDEVSSMDVATQKRVLRLLDEAPSGLRVIAASSKDLEALVQAGELDKDLYYRLAIFTIKIPPLRERTEDIPLLAAELLHELAGKYGKPVTTLPSETQRLLQAYTWPGNVRELRNVIEQAVLLARTADLSPLLLPQMLHRAPSRAEVIKIAIGTAMDAVEREVILRTLEANDGNKTATAEVLGISRRSIYNKLALYGLDNDGSPQHA
jgi:two-component system response regulator AtoC